MLWKVKKKTSHYMGIVNFCIQFTPLRRCTWVTSKKTKPVSIYHMELLFHLTSLSHETTLTTWLNAMVDVTRMVSKIITQLTCKANHRWRNCVLVDHLESMRIWVMTCKAHKPWTNSVAEASESTSTIHNETNLL